MGVARRRAGVDPDPAVTAERIALLLRWRAGDRAAGDLLVRAYFSVVEAAASRWRRGGVRRDDLVQEGRLALLEALRRYDDASAGMPLSAFVAKWICGAVKQHAMNFAAPVRPTDDAARRDFLRGRAPRTVPLEDHDLACEDDFEELAIRPILEADRRDAVERCLELLTERERDVVRRRAMAEVPEKLAAIAAERGLSRQSVHGLEASAMEKMRDALTGVFGMRAEWLV